LLTSASGSNQQDKSNDIITGASSGITTASIKPKRKRWAVDESAVGNTTATTSTVTYKSMKLPSDIIASAVATGTSYSIPATHLQGQDDDDNDPTKKWSKSTYTPQPVAQILGLASNTPSDNTAYYGPEGSTAPESTTTSALVAVNNAELTTLHKEHIYCPNGIVGYIIGRGGEAITASSEGAARNTFINTSRGYRSCVPCNYFLICYCVKC
jgi:hypothetical protein